jgi:hypothetical protein
MRAPRERNAISGLMLRTSEDTLQKLPRWRQLQLEESARWEERERAAWRSLIQLALILLIFNAEPRRFASISVAA